MENTQLQTIEQVEGTPFMAVTNEDGTFLAMANYRLTPSFQTETQCLDYIEENKWTTVMNLFAIAIDLTSKQTTPQENDTPPFA